MWSDIPLKEMIAQRLQASVHRDGENKPGSLGPMVFQGVLSANDEREFRGNLSSIQLSSRPRKPDYDAWNGTGDGGREGVGCRWEDICVLEW